MEIRNVIDKFGRNIHYFSSIYGHSEIWSSFFRYNEYENEYKYELMKKKN